MQTVSFLPFPCTKEISGELHIRITERQIMSTVIKQPLRSMQEEIKEVDRVKIRVL